MSQRSSGLVFPTQTAGYIPSVTFQQSGLGKTT